MNQLASRHFHNILRALLELEDKFIKQPDGSQVPLEIANSSRFYPYFKVTKVNCVGIRDTIHAAEN